LTGKGGAELAGRALIMPGKLEPKDIFSISTSIVAVIISGVALYRSVLYEHDSILVAAAPSSYSSGDGKFPEQVSYSYKLTALIINNGNTSIAVMGVENWLNMRKNLPKTRDDCKKDPPLGWEETVALDFKPFVVKPGETASVDLKFDDPSMTIPKWTQNKDKGGFSHSYFCSELRFDTIGIETSTDHVPIASAEFVPLGGAPVSHSWNDFWGKKPFRLIDRQRYF
jgi:hypothetical protein